VITDDTPEWLCKLLHVWVCPDCQDPFATDCDSTVLAAGEVWTDLKTRITHAGENGYYDTSDVLWWLGQPDALAWEEEEE
jgi:hypothetical protein